MKTKPSTYAELEDGTKLEMYTQNKMLHRVGGPALKIVTANGVVIEAFFEYGKLKRTDGPEFLMRDSLGGTFERYSKG